LDDARNEIDELQKSLWQLQQELEDVGAKEMLKIDISSLDRFADLFFDNLITDWVVQSRIRTSLDQVHQLKTSIQPIQKHLQQRSHALQVSVSQLHSERETLLTK
jgi:multidrug resistance efflux pump